MNNRVKSSLKFFTNFQTSTMEGISSPNSLTYVDEAPSYSAKKPELDTISERSGPTTRSQAKSSALLETVLKTKLVKKARSTSSRFQANSDDSARARTAKAELRSPLKAGQSSSKASAYSRFDTVSS